MAEESKRCPPGSPAPPPDDVASAPRDVPGVERPAPGLYLVATPIGHARDITLRALDILAGADAIAAEDTRRTRKLMQIHGLSLGGRPMISYNDQNGAARRPRVLGWLAEGLSVALVSDAGSPLVADPGYRLAAEAIAAGHPVTTAPGPVAAVAALSLSGLPSDRFLFAGFLPPKSGARRAAIAELKAVPATLVFYESPHRLAACLVDLAAGLGPRRAAVARELTKAFEEVRRAPLDALAETYAETPARGEIAIVVAPPPQEADTAGPDALDAALRAAMAGASLKDAVREVATAFSAPRREVYARALALAEKDLGRGRGDEG